MIELKINYRPEKEKKTLFKSFRRIFVSSSILKTTTVPSKSCQLPMKDSRMNKPCTNHCAGKISGILGRTTISSVKNAIAIMMAVSRTPHNLCC